MGHLGPLRGEEYMYRAISLSFGFVTEGVGILSYAGSISNIVGTLKSVLS